MQGNDERSRGVITPCHSCQSGLNAPTPAGYPDVGNPQSTSEYLKPIDMQGMTLGDLVYRSHLGDVSIYTLISPTLSLSDHPQSTQQVA